MRRRCSAGRLDRFTIDADGPKMMRPRLPDSLRHLFSRSLAETLDRLCPTACVLCNADGPTLCAACRHDIASGAEACCPRCALPLAFNAVRGPCGRCLRRPPAFDRTLAAALYEAPFDQLIRGLKYGATLAYAPLLADLLAVRIASDAATAATAPDVLVPVPLSRQRMATRGFNQSIEIARILARRLARPLDTGSVLRIHDTAPQVALPFDARRRNVRGAFHVVDGRRQRFVGQRVGLVDDVMTTGATLDELARTLKRAGAATVVNLVVARTP